MDSLDSIRIADASRNLRDDVGALGSIGEIVRVGKAVDLDLELAAIARRCYDIGAPHRSSRTSSAGASRQQHCYLARDRPGIPPAVTDDAPWKRASTEAMPLDFNEIGVYAPIMMTATCALFHSRRAARAITGTFDRHLRAAGVKATHFSLLALLSEAEGRTLSEIAAFLAMDRTALARELRALEEVGLLRIESPASDRRTRLASLTKKGKALVVRALPFWRMAQTSVESAMTDLSWPHLLRGMQIAATLG